MRSLLKAFSKQAAISYEGAMIAKAKYQRFIREVEAVDFKNEVIKKSERLCIIKCSGYKYSAIIETLTVYLMMRPQVNVDSTKEKNKGDYWHTFSNDAIKAFSDKMGDMNSIHLTEHPIVQGLFILKKLYDLTSAETIEVKYLHPIYGGDSVFLEYHKEHINGYSNGYHCFLAKLER